MKTNEIYREVYTSQNRTRQVRKMPQYSSQHSPGPARAKGRAAAVCSARCSSSYPVLLPVDDGLHPVQRHRQLRAVHLHAERHRRCGAELADAATGPRYPGRILGLVGVLVVFVCRSA